MSNTLNNKTLGIALSAAICLSAWSATHVPSATAAPVQETVAQPVKLTFSPIEITREIRKANVPASALPLTPQKAMRYLLGADQLLKVQSTPVGTILLFSKQGDRENFYAAYLTKDVLYDLGEIGTRTSLNLTDIRMETLAKTPLLRIRGMFGANVVETTYFYLMGTEPRPLLVVEGPFVERDLDNDGFNELVSSSGTPPITSVYKYIDGRYQQAELNKQLNAVSVQPRKDNPALFDVVLEGQTRPVPYRYSNGTMQPVTR